MPFGLDAVVVVFSTSLSSGIGCSMNSATKLARACALIAVQGMYSMLNSRSSMTHLAIRSNNLGFYKT